VCCFINGEEHPWALRHTEGNRNSELDLLLEERFQTLFGRIFTRSSVENHFSSRGRAHLPRLLA
jgi:hypothetical protein